MYEQKIRKTKRNESYRAAQRQRTQQCFSFNNEAKTLAGTDPSVTSTGQNGPIQLMLRKLIRPVFHLNKLQPLVKTKISTSDEEDIYPNIMKELKAQLDYIEELKKNELMLAASQSYSNSTVPENVQNIIDDEVNRTQSVVSEGPNTVESKSRSDGPYKYKGTTSYAKAKLEQAAHILESINSGILDTTDPMIELAMKRDAMIDHLKETGVSDQTIREYLIKYGYI